MTKDRLGQAFNKQDSGMFQSFANADALIISRPAKPAQSGDIVTILPIPSLI